MEEIEMDDFDEPHVHSGRLMIGAAIMALGVVSLLVRLNILWPWVFALYFPSVLIVFGMIRIMWPSRRGQEIGGMWIALAGGLLLFDRLDIMKLREAWPVVVIMAGLTLVVKALGWLPDRRQGREDRGSRREVGL
jgi:cell wall-active antibiotic response 4TMS protein YvqF